jgi:hypothetical protein
MKTIGIVGSRRRDRRPQDFHSTCIAFWKVYEPGDKLVSGGCPTGGDKFAEMIAKTLGLTITIHYPNWDSGKNAGFVRNTKIADDCDVLIAVVAKDRTGGTEDTIRKVQLRNKPVILVK